MSSRSASQPAPLPLNPYRASSEADYDQYSGSPRSVKSFKFPASSENGDGDESRGPTSPSPASDMGPPPLPAKTTRIPRLSLVPASRDQWQAHRNKLSAGGSSSSLKEMMEKKGGGAITTEIRVECLERRVRNSKEDAVGLAKDILSLCEEAANVKQWYSSLAEKTDSIVNTLTEYRDENQQLRSSLASHKLRNEELSSNVSKLAKQLNNQADAFRELHAQVADQDRKIADLNNPRDESFMTSATSLSQATITESSPDLMDILARLHALEIAPPPTAVSAPVPVVPSTPAQVAEEKDKLRRAQEEHDREERRARQRELEAREREEKMQALLGEALQRNITLAARVRELEKTATAHSQSLALSLSSTSINTHPAQTPSVAHHPRKSSKDNAPAPTIPALDPFSPFVVDKGQGGRLKGLVRGKGMGLRE